MSERPPLPSNGVESAPSRRRIVRLWSRLRRIEGLPRPRLGWPRFLIIGASLTVAAIGLCLALINSPLMDIKRIEVEGADVVSAAAVRQLAGLKGEHVMLADLSAARDRIATLPMVREVTVSRDWPDGVRVAIVERRPWGRWRADDTVWAIDSQGIVLEGAAPSFDGPIVTQTSALPAIRAGAQVDLDALEMAAEIDRRGAPLPLPGLVGFQWSLSDGLVVNTEHGDIVFGDAEGFDYKYAVWRQLEVEAQRRGEPLLFADLRFGLRPRVEIGLNQGRGIRLDDERAARISR